MSSRSLPLVVAAGAALLVLAGCSSTSGSPVPSSGSAAPPTSTADPAPSATADPTTGDRATDDPATDGTSADGATPDDSTPDSSATDSTTAGGTTDGTAPTIPTPGASVSFSGLPDEGVSGLVAVPGREGAWFAITDRYRSGDLLVLYADGSDASIPVAGLEARNLEALAAGPCAADDPTPCLYLADIGDNSRERESIRITRVPLVDPAAPPAQLPGDTWDFTYPDGPHDAEAMVVDAAGRVVVVTKASDGDPDHQVFVGEPGGGQLQPRHVLEVPAPERPLQSLLVGTVVTDAAWDGHRMLVLTYDQVLEYTAPAPDSDPADFPTWPVRELPHPRLVQTEGIAAAADGCGYTVVSEGRGGPVALSTAGCSRPD